MSGRAPASLAAILVAATSISCANDSVTALMVIFEIPVSEVMADQVQVALTLDGLRVPGNEDPQSFPKDRRALGRQESLVIYFGDDAAGKMVEIEAVLLHEEVRVTPVRSGEKRLVRRATETLTLSFAGTPGDGGAQDGGGPRRDGPAGTRDGRDGPAAPDGSRTDATDAPSPVDLSPDPDAAPTCGDPGQLCCTGSTCNGGGCCSEGRCLAVGASCPAGGSCAAGMCTACGGPGQGCCANNQCANGGCCVGSTCVAAGTACRPGQMCASGSCAGCGAMDQPCCAMIGCTAPQTICATATMRCVSCGINGRPCCANNQCATGHFCDAGSCMPCGALNQRCCPAATSAAKCNAPLCCNALNQCIMGTLGCVVSQESPARP